METPIIEALCVLCQDEDNKTATVKVREKGILTLIEYCSARSKNDLGKYLSSRKDSLKDNSVIVNESCRRDFTNQLRKGPVSFQYSLIWLFIFVLK